MAKIVDFVVIFDEKVRKRHYFESALTFGDWDINRNWLKYKEEFMKGTIDE